MWFVLMKSRLASFLLCLLIVKVAAAQSPRGDVLSTASADHYWAIEVIPAGARNSRLELTEIRMRDAGGGAAWRRVGSLSGRVIDAAHRHDEAAVLLDDQSWLLIWPGGSSTGPRLPDGAIMRAIGSDEQSLWALGVYPANSPATTRPATQRVEAGSLHSFIFTGGSWTRRAVIPADVRNDVNLSFSVIDNRPAIVWQTGPRELQFTRLRRTGEWTAVETINTDIAIATFELLEGAPSPTIWLAGENGAGELRVRSEQWGAPLLLDADDRLKKSTHRTAEFFAGNVRLLAKIDDRLFEQPFALGGQRAGDAAALGRLPPATKPVSTWSVLLMALIAALLTTAVFRNEPLEEGSKDRPAFQLAPFSRRFVAGTIDMLPLFIAVLWRVSIFDQDDAALALQDTATWMILAGGLVAYLLYTTLMELTTARTVGKIALGLRVTKTDGTPAGKLAIVVRNLVRPLDLVPGLPLALLILFSPLRQRLGDVLAGTTVIYDFEASEPLIKDRDVEPET
jgi:uncharacterized RDD family membrane protein YckC